MVLRVNHSVRPFDDILIQDARSVCHYLLYIADIMRKELLQASPPNLNLVSFFPFFSM